MDVERTTILFAWLPPLTHKPNGCNISYLVKVTPPTGSPYVVETNELFLNVSSLLSNTQYLITVAAKLTTVCIGPYSSAIAITTQPPGIEQLLMIATVYFSLYILHNVM